MSFRDDLKAAKDKLQEARKSDKKLEKVKAKIELSELVEKELKGPWYKRPKAMLYTVSVFGFGAGIKILLCVTTGICLIF